MTDVCVVGTLVVDHLVDVARRPVAGETTVAHRYQRRLGGKGFNQAVAAARAGAATALVGAVGDDDAGREFLAHLGQEHIDHRAVHRSSAVPTGFALPVTDRSDGENAIVVVPLANELVEPANVASSDIVRDAGILLLQLELPVRVAVEAAVAARRRGQQVVLNAAPVVDGLDLLWGQVDHLVLNRQELMAAGGPGDTMDVATGLLEDWSCSSVVVTLGADGAVVAVAGSPSCVPPLPVVARNTVGAGDAFCGALAARLAGGADLLDAVQYANVAAALTVAQGTGAAGMPTHQEVVAVLRSHGERTASVLSEDGR